MSRTGPRKAYEWLALLACDLTVHRWAKLTRRRTPNGEIATSRVNWSALTRRDTATGVGISGSGQAKWMLTIPNSVSSVETLAKAETWTQATKPPVNPGRFTALYFARP